MEIQTRAYCIYVWRVLCYLGVGGRNVPCILFRRIAVPADSILSSITFNPLIHNLIHNVHFAVQIIQLQYEHRG